MKSGNLLFIALCSLLLFSGCNKAIFSESMSKRLSGPSVQKVQFYVSSEIVLKRELNNSDAAVAKGEIKFQGGKYCEFITIPKGAPGVCANSYTNESSIFMDLSFDSTGRTLRFDNFNCKFPEEAPDGSKPFGVFWKADNSTGKPVCQVRFGDQDYELYKGAFISHLLVKKQKKQNVSKSEEVIKGRKLE